jgi:putative ABC transport system permease protein
MFKNYFKISLRNIKKQKSYSFINIFGLTIGLSCSILILFYIQYEFSFDKYHQNAKDIYRVVMKQPGNVYQGMDRFNVTPGALKDALLVEFPEVLSASRVQMRSGIINYEGNRFTENRICLADPEFLKIFTFPLKLGDPEVVLNKPFSILISQTMSEKYFADEDPIGKTLLVNNEHEYLITGIIENIPKNSHFTFDFLASFSSMYAIRGGRDRVERWNSNSYQTYIQLQNDFNKNKLEAKFPEFVKRYKGAESTHQFILEPLTGIHLGGNLNFEIETNSDVRYIYLFSAIGFFILFIACLNYMNLSTARSINRNKEIGVRKVVGARRSNLIFQFFGDSLLFSFIALLISMIFIWVLLPIFGSLLNRELSIGLLNNISILSTIIGLSIFVGIIAGSYPALFLSSLQPINIIKGTISRKSGTTKSSKFRNSLVLIQFVISIILIVCTLAIYNQLHFIQNKNLGFTKEHILTIYNQDKNLSDNYGPFKNELIKNPDIFEVIVSENLPVTIRSNSTAKWEGQTEDDKMNIYRARVDYDFIDFYKMKLIEGRNFSPEIITDKQDAFILNKTAAKALGWENPIGKPFGFNSQKGVVIGVIDDFHYYPLYLKIEP